MSWAPPPTRRGSHAMSWWALGLSFVPFGAALVSPVLALVVLAEHRRDGRDNGRGKAAASLVVTTAWFVLAAVVVGIVLSGRAERGPDGSVTEAGHVFNPELRVGDCLRDESQEGLVVFVHLTPCDEPHRGEVYAAFDLAAPEFPGDDEVDRLADGGCLERLPRRAGRDATYYYFVPEGADGYEADPEVICIVDLSEARTGRVVPLPATG